MPVEVRAAQAAILVPFFILFCIALSVVGFMILESSWKTMSRWKKILSVALLVGAVVLFGVFGIFVVLN